MATVGLGFQLSANATQMSAGINAGVVELQKLGYAAKRTQQDVSTLKTIELSRVFISAIQSVAGSFTSFVAGAASAVASVDDLSKRTGVSAQTLQAYQFAAEQSGVSVETFGKGIQRLGINLGEAQTGNKSAIKSFADLGLSVRDLAQLSPEQAFEKVAAAISQLPNPAQQAAAAVGLFGKSGAELVPVFQEGAGFLAEMRKQAEGLGLVLGDTQVQNLAQLDDSFGVLSATVQAFKQRVTADLAPALTEASRSAAEFIASIDVQAVAKAAEGAIASLADAGRVLGETFLIIYKASAPLASAVLPVIADTLSLIGKNIQGAALGGLAAAGAFGAYSLSCVSATAATAALTAAVTTLLSRTGVGLLVVVLGAVAGTYINMATAAGDASDTSTAAADRITQAIAETKTQIDAATGAAKEFGAQAELAFKLPAEITDATLIQGTVDEATSAFKKFAQEAGSLSAVPKEVADAFDTLTTDIDNMNAAAVDAGVGQQFIADSAQELLTVIERVVKARADEKRATDAVTDAARKASDEAGKRVQGLVDSGITDSEKSRFEYTKDLLAIQQTISDAERALADARKTGDAQAISAAQQRLALTQQTAAAATDAAKEQARQRELSALGLDQGLLKPVQTVTDQFKKVREAFDRGLIDGGEARTALQNLASEGIAIRKEIAAELARPSTQALQASDLRTQAGASEFLRLATGRADPAIEQRIQQLSKLEEIRRAIAATGANPVEILGA
jgi:hypothetical protein